MSSLTSALRIGISGMQMSQVALGTVSQNVVNANTPGYSRQIIQTGATSSNGFGNGVQLQSIQRISDRFLVGRSLLAASDASYASTARSYLDTVEGAISNASADGGIEDVIGNFLKSFNQLTVEPSNSSLRRNVLQQADIAARTLNDISTNLNTTANDADAAISSELLTVNQLIKDIYQLNGQISSQQASGNGANVNDLLDARDQKVAALSERFSLQVTENTSTGGVRITTENGRKLVDEGSYVQLARGPVVGNYPSIIAQNVLTDGSLSAVQLPIDASGLTSGKIKALVDARDITVPNALAQLDELAETLAGAVNSVASQGTSYPPVRTQVSGNTGGVTAGGTDLYTTTGFTGLPGQSFNISVVNSLGNVVDTTVGGTSITFPALPGTFSLNDLAALINNNADIGNTALGTNLGVTASVATNSDGQPYLQITSTNGSNRIVLSNVTGNPLGTLGMNNLFSGTTASTITVNSAMAANPDLLPVARMRADGGVSSTDNQNIVALAQVADTKYTFAAAGGLGTQTDTPAGYASQIVSNLAVKLSSAKDRETFASSIQTQLTDQATSISGVNINEELSQMLVYQNSFQASARIVTVVNQLLQELVDSVR